MSAYVCNERRYTFNEIFKRQLTAPAGVAQWFECGPANQRVTGSIPILEHIPGLPAGSPVEGV